MTRRRPCLPAPGPLEPFAVAFDGLFASLAQRRAFRACRQGLLLPRDRNKTLTALTGAEPVVGAQGAAVQRLQRFLSESTWSAEAVNARRLEAALADPTTAPHDGGALILDNVENRSLADCRRALTPAGTLVLNSGTGAQGLGLLVRLVTPLVLSLIVRHRLRRYLSVPNHDDLVVLKELVEAGQLRPVIDRTCTLRETPPALAYIEGGHVRGKVVVTVEP